MSLLNKLRCAMTMGQGLALPEHSPQENDQPYQLFQKWFHDAQDSGIILPESMTLPPSVPMVSPLRVLYCSKM
ncbi:hypothetical protein PCI56_14300 [Plesiomonas shigelloides subsp. oncorhynchi]|nr:hypothetical protein [Plesiomonas shigelloides]